MTGRNLMRFIPAWKEARYAGQTARNGQLARNTEPDDGTISQQILRNQLASMFSRYKFDEQKCFFCGERGHHTGYLTASIWLCRANACATQYRMAKEDL
jgi:hypothetical protein